MDVYLIDPSKPLSEDSPSYTTDEVMAITGVDLYALAKGKLFCSYYFFVGPCVPKTSLEERKTRQSLFWCLLLYWFYGTF